MNSTLKNQSEILAKLGIKKLNPMQEEALQVISEQSEVVLLSPTGTGKTLAFLLPIISTLNTELDEVQALIVVPSRELAIQIETVVRSMGSGFKVNAVYGGRSSYKDRTEIEHRPAILVGTPGRVLDHLKNEQFTTKYLTTLILDEFDKSLEIGFEEEMKALIALLPKVTKRILTSATQGLAIPSFVRLRNPVEINYLDEGLSQLVLKTIEYSLGKKDDALIETLKHQGNSQGIIFCNFKESIQQVIDLLLKNRLKYGVFHGGLEQIDRERALIKFRNGTSQFLLATDLAARGIDIPEIRFIIHYELPKKKDEFTHRNGRTARMKKDGVAFLLKSEKENLPDFIKDAPVVQLKSGKPEPRISWKTLHISGGRKDKISKGDIAGFFLKQGKLDNDLLGLIEIKQDCAYVAVVESEINKLIKVLDHTRLKTKKVRVTTV